MPRSRLGYPRQPKVATPIHPNNSFRLAWMHCTKLADHILDSYARGWQLLDLPTRWRSSSVCSPWISLGQVGRFWRFPRLTEPITCAFSAPLFVRSRRPAKRSCPLPKFWPAGIDIPEWELGPWRDRGPHALDLLLPAPAQSVVELDEREPLIELRLREIELRRKVIRFASQDLQVTRAAMLIKRVREAVTIPRGGG